MRVNLFNDLKWAGRGGIGQQARIAVGATAERKPM
jgi:hypothetical protein